MGYSCLTLAPDVLHTPEDRQCLSFIFGGRTRGVGDSSLCGGSDGGWELKAKVGKKVAPAYRHGKRVCVHKLRQVSQPPPTMMHTSPIHGC